MDGSNNRPTEGDQLKIDKQLRLKIPPLFPELAVSYQQSTPRRTNEAGVDPASYSDYDFNTDRERSRIDQFIDSEISRLYFDMSQIQKNIIVSSSFDKKDEDTANPSRELEGDWFGLDTSAYCDIMKWKEITALTERYYTTSKTCSNSLDNDRPRIIKHLNLESTLSKYLRSHRHWTAEINQQNYPAQSDKEGTEPMPSIGPSEDKFFSYFHVEKQIGSSPLPPLYCHAACSVDEKIYIFGGLRSIYTHNTPHNLDLSRFEVEGIQYPLPLHADLLNSVAMMPNEKYFVFSTQSNIVREVKPKGEVPPLGLIGMTSVALNKRYLLISGGFILSRKSTLIESSIQAKQQKFKVKFKLDVNHYGYVWDIQTFRFQKFELITHHNDFNSKGIKNLNCKAHELGLSGMFSRIGHSANAVNLNTVRKRNHQSSTSDSLVNTPNVTSTSTATKTGITTVISETTEEEESGLNDDPLATTTTANGGIATVYIVGGFKFHHNEETNKYDFETIKDIWKLEMGVKSSVGRLGNTLIFQDNILTTMVYSSGDNDDNNPIGRAYHITEVLDCNYIFRDEPNIFTTDTTMKNTDSSAQEASPLVSSTASFTETPEKASNLKLLLHGGSTGSEILGDMWWFDFESESWHKLRTYFNKYDCNDYTLNPVAEDVYEEVQINQCGHVSFLIDKFLLFIVGCIPSDLELNKNSPNSHVKDISDLTIKINSKSAAKGGPQLRSYNAFALDIKTQKWMLYKIFHKFEPFRGEQSGAWYAGSIGGCAVFSSSKLYYLGGSVLSNLNYLLKGEESDADKRVGFNSGKKIMLNNAVDVFEFPFGSFTSVERVKSLKYER